MKTDSFSLTPEPGYSLDMSVSRDGEALAVSQRDKDIQQVLANYKFWNIESNFMSSNNFDNADFRKIVEMGERAVPGILEIIKNQPDPVVHALDLIYPGYMKYEGYVPLKDVCETWIITLTALGKA